MTETLMDAYDKASEALHHYAEVAKNANEDPRSVLNDLENFKDIIDEIQSDHEDRYEQLVEGVPAAGAEDSPEP